MTVTALMDRIGDARSLAQIVLETVREPLLVLDNNLEILAASDSFHRSFQIDAQETRDQKLFALDNGVWDIPDLRTLALERLLADRPVMEAVSPLVQEFPRIGAPQPRCCMPAGCRAPATPMPLSCCGNRGCDRAAGH